MRACLRLDDGKTTREHTTGTAIRSNRDTVAVIGEMHSCQLY